MHYFGVAPPWQLQLSFRFRGQDLTERERQQVDWLTNQASMPDEGVCWVISPYRPKDTQRWVQLLDPGQAPQTTPFLQRPLHLGRLRQLLLRLSRPSAAETPVKFKPANSKRLLLAEDNSVNQKVAMKLLSGLGYQVDLARDGLEALKLGQSEKYDLIVMDIQMPNMDGLQAMLQLRAGGYSGPILALTALAGDEDEAACRAAGANAFMSKPLQPEKLEQLLQELIDSPL